MPNYIENKVEVIGEKDAVLDLVNLVSNNGKDYFDFNRIIPMPKELLDVIVGFGGEVESIENKRKLKENYEKFGFSDWYNWRKHFWGTKSNALNPDNENNTINSDGTFNINSIKQRKDGKYSAFWIFDIAWNSPIPIFIELLKRFPVKIIVVSKDEDDNLFYDIFYDREVHLSVKTEEFDKIKDFVSDLKDLEDKFKKKLE